MIVFGCGGECSHLRQAEVRGLSNHSIEANHHRMTFFSRPAKENRPAPRADCGRAAMLPQLG
jgi:hypothetical protein